MKVCPVCSTEFPPGANFCPHDGRALVGAASRDEQEVDLLLGKTIDQRYTVEGRLGQGGMGVVYAGHHVLIDKPVAIKLLRPEYSRKRSLVERFVREARAASHIGHPNIVDVTDFGWLPDGQAYLIMEHLSGTTLAAEIARLNQSRQRMPLSRIQDLTVQVCQGLSAAHAKGIVHRDLKPENVFIVNPRADTSIAEEGGYRLDYVKLLDFGIAKFSMQGARLTQLGSVFGTPQYMSPEQAAGRDADHRGDIYALGCIVYEMISGRPPFVSDTFAGTITKQIKQPPQPPLELVPAGSLPAAIESLVLKMLAKNPDQRPQSMQQVSEALRGCLGTPHPRPRRSASDETSSQTVDEPSEGEQAADTAGGKRVREPVETHERPPRLARWKIAAAVGAMGITIVGLVWGLGLAPRILSSVPGPPGPPTTGTSLETTLALHTRPQGATVLYDGRPVGQSPFTAQVPRGSTVTYIIRMPGFAAVRRVIEARGRQMRVLVRLQPASEGGAADPLLLKDSPPTATDLRNPFPGRR